MSRGSQPSHLLNHLVAHARERESSAHSERLLTPSGRTPDALSAHQKWTELLSHSLRRGSTPMAPTSPTAQSNGSNAESAQPPRHVQPDSSRLSPSLANGSNVTLLPFAPLLRALASSEAVPHVVPIELIPTLGALSPSRRARAGPGPHPPQPMSSPSGDNPEFSSSAGGTAALAPQSLGTAFSLF